MHIVDYQIVEKEKDILQVAEDFAYRNCDRMENPAGHYHGNMNISHRKPLSNYQEAFDYIEYHTKNSIYYDMAVRFYDNESLPSTEKEKQLKEKIQIAKQKLKDYIIKNELTTRESKNKRKRAFFRCPTCKSKIARQYFEKNKLPEHMIVNCPVCKTEIRSETILNQIKEFEEKIIKLKKELTIEKSKPRKGAPIKWLVKIEVHG